MIQIEPLPTEYKSQMLVCIFFVKCENGSRHSFSVVFQVLTYCICLYASWLHSNTMEAGEIDFLEAASCVKTVHLKTAISIIGGLSSMMGMWLKLISGAYFF